MKPTLVLLALLAARIAAADPFADAKATAARCQAQPSVRCKQELASLLVQTGAYVDAIRIGRELVATAEKEHGGDSTDVRDALHQLIGAYEMHGDLDLVKQGFERTLAITRRHDGEASSMYALELRSYGDVLARRQEDAAAQQAYEHALRLDDAAHREDPAIVSALGMSYLKTGQFPRAQAMFQRYLAAMSTQPVTARVQQAGWVASLFHNGGRDDVAKPLYAQGKLLGEQEIARIEKASGADAAALDPLLFSVGWMLYESGDHAGADAIYTRLVALQEKHHSPFVAYAQLASVRRQLGRPQEALALFEKAKRQMGKQSTGMNSMIADIERELGHYKRAQALYADEQAELDREFGKGAILVSRLNLGLLAVDVAAHELDKAQRVLAEELAIAEREVTAVLGTGTEQDHLEYFARHPEELDFAIGFDVQVAPKSAVATKLALTTLLRRKGRVLDASAANLATLRSKLSPADRQLLDQLSDLRARLAKLVVAGSQQVKDYAKQVAALEDQIRQTEVALAGKSAQYKVVSQPVELAAVQKAIPHDARLVELVDYQPRDWFAPDVPKPPVLPRRYAAYVVADRGDPVVVDLGTATAIDGAVATFRKALGDPDDDHVADRARALYELTFKKLAPALGGAKQVLVAPDGALNLVPFAALHDGKQYLVAEYTFTYLTSGRDLLRVGIRGKPQDAPIIFADPDFEGAAPGAPPAGRRSRAMTGLKWPRLPGTAQEADAVVKLLAGARVLREGQATEHALKALHAPKILHLATHGFFLEDTDEHENPLLHSGLAFAGANKLSSGGDDGILTALEASGLDLFGTELVVMSACDTGVGKVVNGDGVYGLRRALVIAGAESLVMSLWQVDDRATRDLMEGYYKRLRAGAGRSAALRDVQLELQRRPAYAHPYFWASFIAAGDRGPL
ncbi:MAG: CHAT domain-containing protein [Acidobacteriota bacterium]